MALGVTSFEFDEVILTRSAHLAFLSQTGSEVTVSIGHLSGDLSGFMHVMTDMHVTTTEAESPYPTAFAIYESGTLIAPTGQWCSIINAFDS